MASPPKKSKTGPVQSATMLNFFRPKPSVKELTAASTTTPASTVSPYFAASESSASRPSSSFDSLPVRSSSSSSSTLPSRSSTTSFVPPPREEKKEVILLSDDPVSSFDEPSSSDFSSRPPPSSRPLSSSSSFASTVTKPSPYASASSSSSWDSLPTTSKSLSSSSSSSSSASSSRVSPYASSASSGSWDALPPVAPKPSPYASAASSSSWDSLPSSKPSSSSFSSARPTSVKPSYSKVVPSYAPVSTLSSSSAGGSGSGAPNRYIAEIAKSGRATCRDFKCKQKIDKLELRIGKITPNFFHEGSDDVMTQWFHPPCIFSALARAKQSTKKIERVEDIENFEGLSEMHQNWIRELLIQNAGTIKPTPISKPKPVAPSSSSSSGSGGGGSSSGSSSGVVWEYNKDGGWYAMASEDSKMLESHYTKGDYHFNTKDISFNKVYQTLYSFHLNGADPTQVNTVTGTATHLRRVVPKSAPPPLIKAKSTLKLTAPTEASTGWEWFNKDRWTPFAAEDADMLESRFQNDEKVFETKKLSFNLAYGTNYKFVLGGSKPTQTNCSTGTVTPIRRVAPPAAEEEEDWWGDDDDTATAAAVAEPEEEEEDGGGSASAWWEWSNMGSWEKFTPKDSKMLENKWKNGELIFCHIISYGGRDHEMYKFNLCGPNPTQRNTETGLTRSLRRRKAGVEPAPSAPKEESDHCWHWLNKDAWTHFMPEDSKMLEEKYQTGNFSFDTSDLLFNKGFTTVYRFNLGGSSPTQKNLSTGSVTSLRRAPLLKKTPSSPPPSLAKKKSSPMTKAFGEKQAKKVDARWEWNKGGDWLPYADPDNHLIETKYQVKEFLFVTSKLSFNAGFSTEYKFLLSGDSPSQTNLKSGAITPMRRVGSSPTSTEADWW